MIGTAFRFLLLGGANTLVTGALLSLLSLWIPYQIAYPLVFFGGLVFSSLLTGSFVFRAEASWKRNVLFGLSYLAIFAVGWLVLAFLNSRGMPPAYNGLVVFVTAPLSFLSGMLIFRRRTPKPEANHPSDLGEAHAPAQATGE